MQEGTIKKIISEAAEQHLGGPEIVNVLKLNMALDGLIH
jgi:K+-transporting ATPase c subunit